jgi:hypothetical protein
MMILVRRREVGQWLQNQKEHKKEDKSRRNRVGRFRR